jgi:valyl-tRNA synthetase
MTGPIPAKYVGMDRLECRREVIEDLRAQDLIEREQEYVHNVGHCHRCETVVEPHISKQWFLKTAPLARPAIEAVESGRVEFVPDKWKKVYFNWMNNIQDWCISRQLWWGHRIPAYECQSCHEVTVSEEKPDACPKCRSTEIRQDDDVLDTWFSSALWPFSTLGWPEQTPELKTYYPTSTLVTGLDILFFWVARMIMMGLKFMGDVPFRDVYIHALVRDAEGQKMSKSKGNVIDPLHVMEQFGTDALRFTLASMASPGRDIKLAEERIEGYRNFANKIWNAARFSLMNLDGPRTSTAPAERSFPDRWILSRLNQTIQLVTSELESYRFDRAANALYQFIWHEYCDWYLELIKPALQSSASQDAPGTRQTLVDTLETTMRLLHPFMPFLTEEIWQTLPHQGESIVVQSYPTSEAAWIAPDMDQRFTLIEQTIGLVRSSRVLLNYSPGQPIAFYVAHDEPQRQGHLDQLKNYLAHLGRGTVGLTPTTTWPTGNLLRLVIEGLSVGIVVAGDVDLNKALDRIIKEQFEQTKEIERLEGKLRNQEFTAKAPPEVITDHQDRLTSLRRDQTMLTSSEQQLRVMLGT